MDYIWREKMITNFAPILLAVIVVVIIVGIIGFAIPDCKHRYKLKKICSKCHVQKPEPKQIEQESGRTNSIGAFLGILVFIIIGFAVTIPIIEMTDYGYVCENNNWTGIHATDDNRYWLFGDKITVLCVDDRTQNSTITNEIKAVRWSESLFNSDISGLT